MESIKNQKDRITDNLQEHTGDIIEIATDIAKYGYRSDNNDTVTVGNSSLSVFEQLQIYHKTIENQTNGFIENVKNQKDLIMENLQEQTDGIMAIATDMAKHVYTNDNNDTFIFGNDSLLSFKPVQVYHTTIKNQTGRLMESVKNQKDHIMENLQEHTGGITKVAIDMSMTFARGVKHIYKYWPLYTVCAVILFIAVTFFYCYCQLCFGSLITKFMFKKTYKPLVRSNAFRQQQQQQQQQQQPQPQPLSAASL
ncbi:unnamed protein product [Adineta steineri]|uniref:Uncharacterized protein n=1 Tax=Adineta steineri TaxID=433720 RepID=A0A815UWJ7_9BILA|nr:unnamed protein product [Adineta steineri]CAF4228452.1 unnamed protein product [Adineta steineri]